MDHTDFQLDEQQRRVLQEYIFNLEDIKEQAEGLAVANAKLKQSQDILMAVLDSTTHGICLARNRTLAWCNRALTDILGWKQEELIGASTDILYPDVEKQTTIEDAIQTHKEGLFTYQYELVHKEGHRVPCLLTGRPQDKNDPSKGYVLSVTDFTKLKQVQEALKTAYEELEVHTNELVLKNEQLGREIKERKETEEKLNQYRNHLEDLVKERTAELKRTNEQLQQEITERKQKEETLRQLEELKSSILSGISHAVLGLEERTIFFANDAVETIFGWRPEELIGKKTRLFYKTAEEYKSLNRLYPVLQQQGRHSVEVACCRKDGREITCRLNISRIGNSLTNRRIVAVYDDISERKKLEEQLLHSQKMEAIGSLAGGIAHDINNILMGIQGYTSLALYDLDKSHPYRQTFESVEELIRSGANLTKQLLGFARKGKYEVKPVNINAVIEKTSAMFGRTKKEITIRTEYEKGLSVVEADEGQIEQVLINLYVNAWHAMPGGGTLHLKTETVLLDDYTAKVYSVTPGAFVRFSVTDTGVGMDSKTQERIFEPFFTTKEMGHGTGLGLASVYGIVKNHGGFIKVESKKGHGSTFRVYLPVSDKGAEEEKVPVVSILGGTETILLVDDEPFVIDVSRQMLEALGYCVMAASSGKEALDIYNTHRDSIALVILDIIMPDMGGQETFTRLKTINKDIKVIVASGYGRQHQADSLIAEGCKGFLQKPFTINAFSQAIRKTLD